MRQTAYHQRGDSRWRRKDHHGKYGSDMVGSNFPNLSSPERGEHLAFLQLAPAPVNTMFCGCSCQLPSVVNRLTSYPRRTDPPKEAFLLPLFACFVHSSHSLAYLCSILPPAQLLSLLPIFIILSARFTAGAGGSWLARTDCIPCRFLFSSDSNNNLRLLFHPECSLAGFGL